MLRVLLIVAGAMALASPALAQDDAQRRTELAQEYVRLVQTDQLGKMIQETVGQQMAADGAATDDQRDFMRRQGVPAVQRMVNSVMTQMVPVMAELHSEAELQALVDFHSTPLGQTIATNQLQVGVRQEAIMQGALIEMMTSLMAKYCAEFDCEAPGAARNSKPAG